MGWGLKAFVVRDWDNQAQRGAVKGTYCEHILWFLAPLASVSPFYPYVQPYECANRESIPEE